MARALRRAARMDARRDGLSALHLRASSPIQKEFGLSSATIGGLHLGRADRRRLRRHRLRPHRRSHRPRARDDDRILVYSFATAGLGHVARALAAHRLAHARRLRHGRRVVVRLRARRGDLAGRASRQGDGADADRAGRSARCFAAAISALVLEPLRLARALPRRRAPRGRRVLHPPRRRGAAGLARARRAQTRRWTEIFGAAYCAAPSSPRLSPASVLVAYWGRHVVAPGLSRVAGREGGAGLTLTKSALLADGPAGRRVLRLHHLRLDRRPLRPPAGVHLLHDRARRSSCRCSRSARARR